MPGPVDYALWVIGALAPAAVLVCAYQGRVLARYFTLNLYMLTSFLLSAGRFVVFYKYGFLSLEYRYFYFYSDAFLTICLFFALMGLYSHVFHEMGVHKHLRFGALLLLALTAWFSYQVVQSAGDRILTRFVLGLQQNLYFVGLVLTYLLWAAIMKLRETRTQLIQLVAALGVYMSAFAGNYALHNLSPGFMMIWSYVPPVMGILLPVAWGYTFLRVPEDARLATAHLAATDDHHER